MIRQGFFFALGIAAGLAASVVQAQQYRWTDKDGRIQYSDAPPPAGAKDVRRTNVTSGKPAAAQVPFEVARLQKEFPVTLYTSPSCGEGCGLAREALNKRGVPFKEIQVWDTDSSEKLKQVSGALEVPTLTVGRTAQRGFEQGAFDSLLDSAGYPKAGAMPVRSQKAPEPPQGYVSPAERDTPKPVAQPEQAQAPQKAGRYDPSGLTGPAPKSGPYDPSNLK